MNAQSKDSEQLGMALEYFQGGKYHEAMLLLEKLDRHYNLNPRYKAYLGVCYYYEWEFKKTTECLDSLLPKLEVFAPHERSVYYYTNAESHFNLGQYGQSIPLYEKTLTVCFENEKAEVYYRLGFSYLFEKRWQESYDSFEQSYDYYQRYFPDQQGRIDQIVNMMAGLQEEHHLNEPAPSDHLSDTLHVEVTPQL
jgi:tetratricopeptide (TPR) repeat protein